MGFDEVRKYWRGFRTDSGFSGIFAATCANSFPHLSTSIKISLLSSTGILDDNSAGVDLDIIR
jgi:hypothetical protein